MNKKLVGIALAFMLGIILIESYFLFVQPNQTVSDVENTADSTLHSRVPSSKNKSSTELPNATTSREGPETNSFTPAVPEFTVELVDSSYDVPTTYSTDPYTGKQVTHEGYHVAKRTIEVRIKNQPFKPYTDGEGREIKFYYNIRIKGHYVEWGSEFDDVYNDGEMPTQSNSECTVISYSSESTYTFTLGWTSRHLEVSPEGRLDFQVRALAGYTEDIMTVPPFHGWFFTGEKSGWSETKTIIIP